MIVKVFLYGENKTVTVTLNSKTRPIIRLLSRCVGSYQARRPEHQKALSAFIVQPQRS